MFAHELNSANLAESVMKQYITVVQRPAGSVSDNAVMRGYWLLGREDSTHELAQAWTPTAASHQGYPIQVDCVWCITKRNEAKIKPS
jgi:uncharacterized lipoprotein YmbA